MRLRQLAALQPHGATPIAQQDREGAMQKPATMAIRLADRPAGLILFIHNDNLLLVFIIRNTIPIIGMTYYQQMSNRLAGIRANF